MKLSIYDLAAIAHNVNRAYCNSLNDNTQSNWKYAPEWQQKSAIAGVKAHIEKPDMPPWASHESWLKQKQADGWVYGPVKNELKKEHPCIVPYSDLPPEQQAKDYIFGAVVAELIPYLTDTNETAQTASIDPSVKLIENIKERVESGEITRFVFAGLNVNATKDGLDFGHALSVGITMLEVLALASYLNTQASILLQQPRLPPGLQSPPKRKGA